MTNNKKLQKHKHYAQLCQYCFYSVLRYAQSCRQLSYFR